MQPTVKESYIKGLKPASKQSDLFLSDPRTLLDCLRFWATQTPENDAFVFRSTIDQRFTISWKEFYERSCKMAMAYRRMGIKAGDVIAIVSRSCPEWLYAVFGAMAVGITVTSIVFTYNDGSDVIQMMGKLRTCSLLIMDPGSHESNWTIFKTLIDNYKSDGHVTSTRMPYLRNLVFVSLPEKVDGKTVSSILEENYNIGLPSVDPDQIAILFQTSGSTGVPKLVAHTQSKLLLFGKTTEASVALNDPVFYNDRPFGWLGGFPFGFLYGQTRVTLSGMCPPPEDKLSFKIDVIQSEGCTSTFLLPPMVYELVRRERHLPAEWPLKTIFTGGMPLTKSLTTCIGNVCKRLVVVYGATEFMVCLIMNVENQDDFVDYSCGKPEHDVAIRVVDKAGNTVPVGERGEIYVLSGFIFQEYFNDPEKTASVKTLDGWYKTDDFGRMNSDGYLFVEGRLSDIIICGGMNVTPAILETVLKAFPGVQSAVVVPVPNKEKYQVVCACVMVRAGIDVTEAHLKEYMEGKHNDEEKLFTILPTYYMFLDKFPEEGTGKVSRKTLKEMANEKYGEH